MKCLTACILFIATSLSAQTTASHAVGSGQISKVSGNGDTLATVKGAVTASDCAQWDAFGNLVDGSCSGSAPAYTGNIITGSGLTVQNWYYMNSSGVLTLAKADVVTTTPAICHAVTTTQCQTSGIATGLSGVTTGTIYYLSDVTAGGSLTSAPTTTGHFIQRVAIGLSSTSILINPSIDVITK